MLKKWIKILVMGLLLTNSLISYSFRINDIDFDQRLDKDGYKEYKIYNDTMQKIRYKVFFEDTGKLPVSKSLEAYPKVITIEPNSYGVLKIYGKGGVDLPTKEHQFILGFKPIIIPTLVTDSKKNRVINGTATVPITPKILMSGYVGEIDFSKHLSVTDIKFEKNPEGKLIAKLKVKNSSHSGLPLGINFSNSDKNILNSKAIGRIAKNSVVNVKVELDSFKKGEDIKYIEFYNSDLGRIVEQKI